MGSDVKIKEKYTKEYKTARRKFKLTLKTLSRKSRAKRLFTAAFSDGDAALRTMMERGPRRAWSVYELNRSDDFKAYYVGSVLRIMLELKARGWVNEVK